MNLDPDNIPPPGVKLFPWRVAKLEMEIRSGTISPFLGNYFSVLLRCPDPDEEENYRAIAGAPLDKVRKHAEGLVKVFKDVFPPVLDEFYSEQRRILKDIDRTNATDVRQFAEEIAEWETSHAQIAWERIGQLRACSRILREREGKLSNQQPVGGPR